jgi:sugar phosphate isomerase/epimerase
MTSILRVTHLGGAPHVQPPISITTGAFYVYPLRAAFRLIADAGFDAVEFVAGPEGWVRGNGYVKAQARAHGLRIMTVHPPILPLPGWTDIPAFLPRMVQTALEMEAEVLCIHPPDVPSPDCDLSQRFVDVLKSCLRLLEGTGTHLALENLAHFSPKDARLWWHDPAHLLALAREMGVPMVFDTAHADSTPLGLQGVYDLFRGRIANVHLSDARTKDDSQPKWFQTIAKHHRIPGEGGLPLDVFLADLLADGYAGPLTLELSPTALAIWSPREARKRLAKAREWGAIVVEGAASSITIGSDSVSIQRRASGQ